MHTLRLFVETPDISQENRRKRSQFLKQTMREYLCQRDELSWYSYRLPVLSKYELGPGQNRTERSCGRKSEN